MISITGSIRPTFFLVSSRSRSWSRSCKVGLGHITVSGVHRDPLCEKGDPLPNLPSKRPLVVYEGASDLRGLTIVLWPICGGYVRPHVERTACVTGRCRWARSLFTLTSNCVHIYAHANGDSCMPLPGDRLLLSIWAVIEIEIWLAWACINLMHDKGF